MVVLCASHLLLTDTSVNLQPVCQLIDVRLVSLLLKLPPVRAVLRKAVHIEHLAHTTTSPISRFCQQSRLCSRNCRTVSCSPYQDCFSFFARNRTQIKIGHKGEGEGRGVLGMSHEGARHAAGWTPAARGPASTSWAPTSARRRRAFNKRPADNTRKATTMHVHPCCRQASALVAFGLQLLKYACEYGSAKFL